MPGPLDGFRVIDVGTRIGAPFCAGLLGEWGAEVVKVEQPGSGDFMRTIGPFDDGYSLFWAVEGRGRKSATCDLRTPEGQELFRRLAATADVVCENFRPGTLEDWGLGPATLAPHLVVVRISAFGQDGPYSKRPGLDRLGVAYGGLLHLTGEADRPPVRPGVTVADYLTGVFSAEAALAALYRRDATPPTRPGRTPSAATAAGHGRGAVVDSSLYGSILRILEWTIPAYERLGTVRCREGNRLANSAPLDNYPTADGRFVCVVAGSDANFGRLCRAMDRPDLHTDPRFATLADRARHGDIINGEVEVWTRAHTAAQVEEACVRFDVPVATAYTAVEIAADAHFAARRDLVTIDDPVLGAVRQQAPYPRLVGETGATPAGAPTLGADNAAVWCDMVGLTADELGVLQAQGNCVIGNCVIRNCVTAEHRHTNDDQGATMAKDTGESESRIALITGASSGIGAALARELAQRGMTVGLVARRHDRLAEVLEDCQVHSPDSRMWAADLSDPDAAADLAVAAWDAFGHIDILVNNAGVPMRKTIPHITAKDIERVMRINFLSSTAMTLALIPRMLARATGVIVNVASIAGRFGVTTEAAYSASKFAMCGWSEGIAADMAGTGVTVRLILPGTIDTELWDQPDNDPPLYQGDLVPAEETAIGIADAIDDEHFEHFLPDMKAVVEAKVADIDKFMSGMVTFHRSQQAAAAKKATP